MNILEIENLQVRRDFAIIENLSWKVRRNEHWCLLGPNGSGKTTLLNVLLGYVVPTSGRIVVGGCTYGRSVWHDIRKKIGIVSHSLTTMMERPLTALQTVVTGREALLNHCPVLTEADREKGASLLARLGCAELAGRNWFVLSQGERQRVLIARALMADAEVLILDEPCAGLDPVAREQFLWHVEELVKQDNAPTVLFVTHHIEEIMPAFTRVMLLKSGRILKAGPKHGVLKRDLLSRAYGQNVEIEKEQNRYRMNVVL
jgi:iron complex transport system ATP-binding protein